MSTYTVARTRYCQLQRGFYQLRGRPAYGLRPLTLPELSPVKTKSPAPRSFRRAAAPPPPPLAPPLPITCAGAARAPAPLPLPCCASERLPTLQRPSRLFVFVANTRAHPASAPNGPSVAGCLRCALAAVGAPVHGAAPTGPVVPACPPSLSVRLRPPPRPGPADRLRQPCCLQGCRLQVRDFETRWRIDRINNLLL